MVFKSPHQELTIIREEWKMKEGRWEGKKEDQKM